MQLVENYFNIFVTSYKLLRNFCNFTDQVRKTPVFFNLMISGQQIDVNYL
jgi:hypothetical protein